MLRRPGVGSRLPKTTANSVVGGVSWAAALAPGSASLVCASQVRSASDGVIWAYRPTGTSITVTGSVGFSPYSAVRGGKKTWPSLTRSATVLACGRGGGSSSSKSSSASQLGTAAARCAASRRAAVPASRADGAVGERCQGSVGSVRTTCASTLPNSPWLPDGGKTLSTPLSSSW